jgi:hypothetical protein
MEGNARDIARMAVEAEQWVGVRRLDVVELDRMVASRSQESLIRRDAQPIDLGVRVLDRTRADSREGLPEPEGRAGLVMR